MDTPTKDPKRTGVKAVAVIFPDDPTFPNFGNPGEIDAKDNYILQACPGCGSISGMLVGHPKPGTSPSWNIMGGSLQDVTTLTLSPSINCVGCCGWHGYLKNGVFESC